MTKKRSRSTQQLLQSEESWARGQKANPTRAREVAAHFLRAYRGRPDLARAVGRKGARNFAARLESTRDLILSGSLMEAEKRLGSLEGLDSGERGEFYLELARIKVISQDFKTAERLIDQALQEPELAEVSRLTCYQLSADAAIKQQQPERAIECLHLAISIAEVFQQVSSAFSARAYLVQAYAELHRPEDARQQYRLLLSMLEQLGSEELWLDRRLTVLRAECQLSRLTGETQNWFIAASEALEIARWIGDRPCLKNCERELVDLSGLKLRPPEVHHFLGWTYLSRLQVLLHEAPREVVRISDRPIAEKILGALLSGPLPKDQLFERVWGIPFRSDRHSAHLMAILSKVRKLLPAGSLVVQSGAVELRRN